MFYPISKKNVERENFGDVRRYYIKNRPAKTNSSHEEKTEGWLGTTNDVSAHALGEYETKEAALEAIHEDVPAGHKLVHIEKWDGSEKWISRPDVSQEDTTLFRERTIENAEILGDLMEDLEKLYAEHGRPKLQYDGAHDTTTGGPADDSLFLREDALDPHGEAPEWAEKIASRHNSEMKMIISALDLSYPRYYTTPEWSAFKKEARALVKDFRNFEAALEWGEKHMPAPA